MEINLKEQTVEQLKGLAYDQLVLRNKHMKLIEVINENLKNIETEINSREVTPEEPVKPVTKKK